MRDVAGDPGGGGMRGAWAHTTGPGRVPGKENRGEASHRTKAMSKGDIGRIGAPHGPAPKSAQTYHECPRDVVCKWIRCQKSGEGVVPFEHPLWAMRVLALTLFLVFDKRVGSIKGQDMQRRGW